MVNVYKITTILFFFFLPSAFASTEPNFAERKDVQTFMAEMEKKHHFKHQELVNLFSQVKPRPQVIHKIKNPLENEPWKLYQILFVNEWRIRHGVKFWDQYKDALARAEKQFNVPASIIVATIGIETKYGQKTGEYRVIDSLSNVGFSDSPRAKFFRKELEQFLLLTKEQKLDPLKVTGSYAGAIGQPQFMPSSYRHYAINFSGSGTTDLMNDEIDVIGSIANYYSKHGWKMGEPVVKEARVIGKRLEYALENHKLKQPLAFNDLADYGIYVKKDHSDEKQKVKLIELQGIYHKEYWLGYRNFDVIKRYNTSDLYALAVYQLSQYITELRDGIKHD